MEGTPVNSRLFRVGIIGAGTIVEMSHLPVLKNFADVSVNWLYDSNANQSDLIARMYGTKSISRTELECNVAEVDICLLSTPYGVRSEYIHMIAQKKKGLYVEKPFALTVQEHKNFSSLFPAGSIAIGFQRRCYKTVGTLKSLVESDILGKIVSINCKMGNFLLKSGKGYLSDSSMSGGGVIIESGIHILDQLLFITNSTDLDVEGVKCFSKDGIDYDTSFETTLKTSSGTIKVECEMTALRNLVNGVTIQFENAVVITSLSHDSKIEICNSKFDHSTFLIELTNDSLINSSPALSINGAFHCFWKEYLNAIESGATNFTSAENSLLTTRWIEEIYKRIKS